MINYEKENQRNAKARRAPLKGIIRIKGVPILVQNMEDASYFWCAYREAVGLVTGENGVSALGNGVEVKDSITGAKLGSVSYNGRMWDKDGKEIG